MEARGEEAPRWRVGGGGKRPKQKCHPGSLRWQWGRDRVDREAGGAGEVRLSGLGSAWLRVRGPRGDPHHTAQRSMGASKGSPCGWQMG